MAERRVSRSTMPSSSFPVVSIPSRVRPSAPVSAWRETTGSAAVSAAAMSSGDRPVSSASSDRVGSRPRSAASLPRAARTADPRSFNPRLTFTGPSSRRKRRISPAILGTA